MNQRQLLLTPASKFKTQRQRWLSTDRVPLGTPTLFGGRGGEGKSTFALHVAAQLTRGTLDGDLHGEPKSVLIISHEDDWGMVMKPRLIAAGADLDLVYQLVVKWQEDEFTGESTPSLPLDISIIREAIEQTGAGLLIIDPLASTMGGDHYKVADVRRALDPLAQLAQEMGVGVIGIMHFNKGVGNASDKLSGSHAFRDAVRSVLLFATDEETGRRIVSVDKSNYSKAKGQSFAFNLVSVPVETDDGEIAEMARVEELGESDLSVSDIINRVPSDPEEANDSDDAAAWLRDYLVSVGGSSPKRDVENAARKERYSDKVLRRAREKAGISTARQGFPSTTIWSLSAAVAPSQAQSRPLQEVGTSGHQWGTTDREPSDQEVAPVSYLDNRDAITERAGMFCIVCNELVGMSNPGYCDSRDTAHVNHRADMAAEVIA